jgi:glycosyltransferase involved in cell wall biosynthesis
MKKNKLAIIIPAYKATFLEETLLSIANQTCKNFTLYIGDDCSPYNLKSIITPFEHKLNIVYKRFNENLGSRDLVAQWKRCIDMSQEEWIWLFSDDDIMESTCVESFFDTIKKTKSKYDIYHFDINIINDKNTIIRIPKSYPQNLDALSYYKNKLLGNITSLVVENIFSREIYNQTGGFETFDLAWGSDTATWVKFSYKKTMYTIYDSKILWRSSGENISPNNTNPIVARKVKALNEFLSWSYGYFQIHNKNITLINIKAFIKRMRQFKTYITNQELNSAITSFCKSHNILWSSNIIKTLIKI